MVRAATEADLPAIQKLNQSLFEFEHRWNESYLVNWAISEAGAAYFRERLTSDILLVAVENDAVEGYICGKVWDNYTFRTSPFVAEIENMYVQQTTRGKGLGKQLYLAFKETAMKKGAKFLQVTAFQKNLCAVGFYQHMGLEPELLTFEVPLQ